MNAGNDTNLKKLIGFVQQKGVVTAPFLLRQGIGYQSMFEYRQSGWLTALGVGAFCGKGTKPSLDEALSALSDQLKLPLHLGGNTALARRGIQQYVPLGGLPSELYLRRGIRLPKWFCDSYAGQFIRNSSNSIPDETGIEQDPAGYAVSSPERAFLELAAEVPTKIALGELYQLMEFADTLRPDLVSELLAKCRSVKAKRVFLFLAEDLDHWWAKKMDIAGVDLGSGCRVLDKGGQFQPKYHLIVKPWREY
jgi:hypothetical protein